MNKTQRDIETIMEIADAGTLTLRLIDRPADGVVLVDFEVNGAGITAQYNDDSGLYAFSFARVSDLARIMGKEVAS
jgi:hypothetical protein